MRENERENEKQRMIERENERESESAKTDGLKIDGRRITGKPSSLMENLSHPIHGPLAALDSSSSEGVRAGDREGSLPPTLVRLYNQHCRTHTSTD